MELPALQFPRENNWDPKADLLAADKYNFTIVTGDNVIDRMHFNRLGSVLQINIKNAVGDYATDNIKQFEMTVPSSYNLAGTLKYNAAAEDVTEGIEVVDGTNTLLADLTYINGPQSSLAPLNNCTFYILVAPGTITSGSEITFTISTNNHDIIKTVTLGKDLKMESKKISHLNINLSSVTSYERVYYQDNFEWVGYWWDDIATGDKKSELDPVGTGSFTGHSQPNIWSKYSATVGTEYNHRGYTDFYTTGKTTYMQKNYLKRIILLLSVGTMKELMIES